jgi:hypothetical protein
MKKMILGAAFAAFLSTQASAQSMAVTTDRTTFGIRAGINFQNLNGKDFAGNDLKNDLLTGFNAGVNAEMPLGSGFYLQPGVLYSIKGAKNEDLDSKVKLAYIEVPVNFIYKPVLGTGNMLLGFGPYVGFGINGTIENNGAETDIDFGADYNPANPATQIKSFDAGGNLLAGYEFANKLSFQLNAQLGMMNINKDNSNDDNDKTRLRNTGFGLSLGYRF